MADHSSEGQLVSDALTLQTLGKDQEALSRYAKAYTINPQNSLALWGMATCLYETGKKKEGIEELEKGRSLFPTLGLFHDSLISAYSNEENYAKALAVADDYLHTNPTSLDAHVNKAKVLMRSGKGKKKEVYELLDYARSRNPLDKDTIEITAEALWQYDRNKIKASELYEEALRQSPADAYLHNNYGVFLLGCNEPHRALEAFRTAIRLEPTLQLSADNLGRALAATHPFLNWTYRYSRFWDSIPVIRNLSWILTYFILRFVFGALVALGVPSELLAVIAIATIIIAIYSFIGNRLFMFAFRRGWIT